MEAHCDELAGKLEIAWAKANQLDTLRAELRAITSDLTGLLSLPNCPSDRHRHKRLWQRAAPVPSCPRLGAVTDTSNTSYPFGHNHHPGSLDPYNSAGSSLDPIAAKAHTHLSRCPPPSQSRRKVPPKRAAPAPPLAGAVARHFPSRQPGNDKFFTFTGSSASCSGRDLCTDGQDGATNATKRLP
jgi:hypothetical protein